VSETRDKVPVRTGPGLPSIDDEKLGADLSEGPVCFSIVRHLVAHSRREDESSPVFELRTQHTFNAEKNVSLGTPVVGKISWRIFDAADADRAEDLRTPMSNAGFASVFG
jgi:hypothetical protein